jgi:hypothetical protein
MRCEHPACRDAPDCGHRSGHEDAVDVIGVAAVAEPPLAIARVAGGLARRQRNQMPPVRMGSERLSGADHESEIAGERGAVGREMFADWVGS